MYRVLQQAVPQFRIVHPSPLVEAVRITGHLANRLGTPVAARQGALDADFRLLAVLIEALPPTVVTLGTLAYLRNRLESSSLLHDAEEYQAAGYQLREMSRKLARLARIAG